MKQKIYLIIFFCAFYQFSFGQVKYYVPFPVDSAVWNQEFAGNYMICGNPIMPFCEYTHTITGDTVVNNLHYHKIESSIHYFQNCGGPMSFCDGSTFLNYNGYTGALREDTSTRRVYFLFPGNIAENLLYNFDLAIGDTLEPSLMYNPSFMLPLYVTSIDSMWDGNGYRRRFNLNAVPAGFLIEGIGNSLGLFDCIAPFETYSTMTCFSHKQNKILPQSNTGVCGITSLQEMNDAGLHIYPNPSGGIFSLSKYIGNIEVLIYNSYGQQIQFTKSDYELDITTQPAGLYIIMIRDGEKNYVSKAVKE